MRQTSSSLPTRAPFQLPIAVREKEEPQTPASTVKKSIPREIMAQILTDVHGSDSTKVQRNRLKDEGGRVSPLPTFAHIFIINLHVFAIS